MDGEIVHAIVDKIEDTDSDTIIKFVPKIRYRYSVDGKDFQNDDLYPSKTEKTYSLEVLANIKLLDLTKNEEFVVFYDHENPRDSALTRSSLTLTTVLLFLLSGLVTIIPILTWLREDKDIIDPKNY